MRDAESARPGNFMQKEHDSGYEQTSFAENPEIDSIFCATDSIAIGGVTYLREIGRQVPEEIQIAGIEIRTQHGCACRG